MKFEKASGLDLSRLEWGWQDPVKLGEAVDLVMHGKHLQVKEELVRLLDTAERIVQATKLEIKKMGDNL